MAKGSTIVIIVLLAIIVVGGGIFAGLLISGNLPIGGQQTPSGSGLYIDPSAGEYVAPTQAPQAPQETKPGIAIPSWSSLTIPANTTEVSVDFFNPEANDGYYYMTFELRLADGEVLYTSGLVPPGKHIQKITLSRGLPTGKYDAAVFVQPYNMDDTLTPTNNADLKIKLIVV